MCKTTKNGDLRAVRKSTAGQGSFFEEQSALEDHVDEIYKNEDPILVSMNERLDQGGFAQAVIKNRCRVPKYFFPTSLNGKGLELKNEEI